MRLVSGKYVVIRAEDGHRMSGTPGDENEAVVIMVGDKYAPAAFVGYADAAMKDGQAETAAEFMDLAERAGPNSPYCDRDE
jgi:hypothetical protein